MLQSRAPRLLGRRERASLPTDRARDGRGRIPQPAPAHPQIRAGGQRHSDHQRRWGYSTQYPAFAGKDAAARDEQQAKWLARQFLTNIANDVALSIWYDWRDDGTNPKEPEHHFGVVAHEYHAGRDPVYDPKPAYTAMKTMTEELRGLVFNKQIFASPLGTFPCTYIFGDERSSVVTATLPFASTPGAIARAFSVNICVGEWNGIQVVENRRWRASAGKEGIEVDPREDVTILKPIGEIDLFKVFTAWERAPIDIPVRLPPILPGQLPDGPTARNVTNHPMRFQIIERARSQIRELNPDQSFLTPLSMDSGWRLNQRLMNGIGTDHDASATLTLEWDGQRVSAFQHSRLNVLNPLTILVLPPGKDFVPVWIENPSGEAGELHIDARSERNERHVYPFAIAEGKTSQWELIPMSREAISSGDGRLFAGAGPLFRPVKSGVPIGEWGAMAMEQFTVHADGRETAGVTSALKADEPAAGPPLSARKSLGIAYAFTGGWQFLCVERLRAAIHSETENRIPYRARAASEATQFAFWLHGDGKGCQARIRFKDATGQVFQPDGPRVDWKGWRYVTFPMQATEEKPLAHWGGKNDGVIHYPIEWDSIFILDNVSRQPVEGEIYLSAPTLIY